MKNIVNASLVTLLVVMVVMGCKKTEIEAPDDFNVTAATTSCKVGDTLRFALTGKPDMIVFFSGELGKAYANAERSKEAGSPKLWFQTNMTQGLLPNNDSLRLMISSNLKGYDSLSVLNATWTDITARNTKWPTALSTTFTMSDTISLNDFNSADSVNIAFRAMGKKYATAAQRKWQIQNLVLNNNTADGLITPLFSTFANTGWVQTNIKNNPPYSLTAINYNAWNVGEAGVNAGNTKTIVFSGGTSAKAANSSGIPIQTAYPITFDPGATVNVDDNDDWLITSAIDLKTVKPDVGVVIKNSVASAITSYNYRFTKAGTYTVTFLAQNNNKDIQKQTVKQLQITVTP